MTNKGEVIESERELPCTVFRYREVETVECGTDGISLVIHLQSIYLL